MAACGSTRLARLNAHLKSSSPATEAAPVGTSALLPLLAGAALGAVATGLATRRPPSKSAWARPPLGGADMTSVELQAEQQLAGLTAADITVSREATPQQVAAVLEEFGAVIIERAVPEATMDAVDEQLETCICAEQKLRGVGRQAVLDRRMGAEILVGAPTTRQLLTNSLVTSSVQQLLGRHSKRLALKLLEVVYLEPGSEEQVLHREDGLWPSNHQPFDWVVDCMWAVSDFTGANGGTLLIPKSHRWRRERAAERPEASIQCVMPKGSVLIWAGATLHGGGANTTEHTRRSLLTGYVCGWLRSEHRFWAYRPLRDLVNQRQQNGDGEISAELCDLLGFGPTDGSAPGGGGSPRDGWTSPRSQHYYLGRTQEQSRDWRDTNKYDGAGFFERYYEVEDPIGTGARPTLSLSHCNR